MKAFLAANLKREQLIIVLVALGAILSAGATAVLFHQVANDNNSKSRITPPNQQPIISSYPLAGPSKPSTQPATEPQQLSQPEVQDSTYTAPNIAAPANASQPNKQTQSTTPTSSPTPTTPATPEPEPAPPPPPAPESPSAVVAFYADNQSDSDSEDATHQRTVNNILAKGANPVFHAGDIMEDGTQESLIRFNNVTNTLRSTRTFYAALGNNDRTVGDTSTPSQLFLANFNFPNNERWYSVNIGNLHMIILDSAFAAASQSQKNWLATDLQSTASQNRITGVLYHHPSFSSSINSYLINHGADFVVAGHNHSYQHTSSNGIHYFVTSGQPSLGYLIAKVYSDKVTMTAYNQNNGTIDSVTFNKR